MGVCNIYLIYAKVRDILAAAHAGLFMELAGVGGGPQNAGKWEGMERTGLEVT